MLLKEILILVNDCQIVEIANERRYYYGPAKNIPTELLSSTVVYLSAGQADTDGANNVLLFDTI